MTKEINRLAAALFAVLVLLSPVWVFDTVLASEESDLAQDLTNPLADLMTIPIQVNVDRNIGVDDEGTVDHRHPGQPCLVLCRGQ